MPKPHPPAYVKMPGRPKTQRTREPTEKTKGAKLSKVGIKMRYKLCHQTTHNSRTCARNKEVGSKNNRYIRRDATRKWKQSEATTFASATSFTMGDVGTQQSTSRSSLPPSVGAPSSALLVQRKCRKRARPA